MLFLQIKPMFKIDYDIISYLAVQECERVMFFFSEGGGVVLRGRGRTSLQFASTILVKLPPPRKKTFNDPPPQIILHYFPYFNL